MRRYAVYTCKDADGKVLYVGRSTNVVRRMAEHQGQTFWFSDVASVDVEWFSKTPIAEEQDAIRERNPEHNKMHKVCNGPQQRMSKRDTWLQVRVSREEREAFAKLSDQVRRPLSDIIRDTLHEMAERVAKEREREE